MLAYTLRRLLLGCVTLLGITFLVFALSRAMPGDATFVGMEDPERAAAPEDLAEARRALGLDRPWPEAYLVWLRDVCTGDLGMSFHRQSPVATRIGEALGPTLLLSGTSLFLAYLISVPLGVFAARRRGSATDRVLGLILYVLHSIPGYVVAVTLLLCFSVKLDWLPLQGMRSTGWEELPRHARMLDLAAHMVLPVICHTYGAIAFLTRFLRASMAEALEQDYVRTARAKGLPERLVVWKHAFRNALVPFLTLLGLSLPGLVAGSVVLERIFAWPGMGRLFLEAIQTRDYPLIQGLTLVYAVLVLAGTLLADILCARADPRISHA